MTEDASAAGIEDASADAPGNPTVDADLAAPARLAAAVANVDFGSQALGAGSATRFVMIANTGGAESGVPAASVTDGPFKLLANGCGVPLASGASCSLLISFTPTELGAAMATLTVKATPGGEVVVPLSGQGVPKAQLQVDRTSVDFGPVTLLQTSAPVVVRFTNVGGSPSSSLSFTRSVADFRWSGTCASIPPGGHCDVSLTYVPTIYLANGISDTLVVQAVNGGRLEIKLTGSPRGAIFKLTPQTPIDLGTVDVLQTGPSVMMSITNEGNVASAVPTFAKSGTDAADVTIAATTCNAALMPGASCTLSVALAPTTGGAKVARVRVDGAAWFELSPPITGFGRQPSGINVSPAFIKIAAGNVNSNVLTVKNDGAVTTGALSVEGATLGATTGYQLWNDGCSGKMLAAGATCTVLVRWHGSTPPEGYTRFTVRGTPGGTTSSLMYLR